MTTTVQTTSVPGDDQRPRRRSVAAEASVDLENFVLISYAVPAERVARHLPEGLALETFEGDDGSERCVVTTACFCNRDLRWRLTQRPTHTFNQVTFRTPVTHGDDRGLYFFGSYCDTLSSWAAQRALATGTKLGKFDVDVRRDGRAYARYSCRVLSGDEVASWEVEARDQPEAVAPFSSAYEHVQFVTYRLHGFSRNAFGFYSHGRVDHRRLKPLSGNLLGARFDFWERLGILERDEVMSPLSVLVEPHIRFVLLPPRAAWL